MSDKTIHEVFKECAELQAKIAELSVDVAKRTSKLSEDLRKVDNIVSDVYHAIEHVNLNAFDSFKATKVLQRALQIRRVLKEELALRSSFVHKVFGTSASVEDKDSQDACVIAKACEYNFSGAVSRSNSRTEDYMSQALKSKNSLSFMWECCDVSDEEFLKFGEK